MSTEISLIWEIPDEFLWVETEGGPAQVKAGQVPLVDWVRLGAGDGAKGPRLYDWTRVPIRPWKAPGKGYWLLVRRSIANPDELAYYVCFAGADTTLEELVRVAGIRSAIEESFEEAKDQVGLDQYQVQRWVGWYRHVTLVLLAHAFLAVTRCQAVHSSDPPQKGASWRG